MKWSAFMLLGLSVLIFKGCGNKENMSSADKKASCTLNVVTNYSGTGIDGQKLDGGTFTESFQVFEGDCFYEDYYGHWNVNGSDVDVDLLIAEIKEVDSNGVTAVIDGEQVRFSYDVSKTVSSTFFVYDGTNYDYKILFGDYEE